MTRNITMIASVGTNRELGAGGELCWRIPADLKRFKRLTTGHAVVMGRKTWESLPVKPLGGRLNIVITHNENYQAPGATVVPSLEAAINAADGYDIFIIGGESVYAAAMPMAGRLELTRVMAGCPEADAFFPEFDPAEWAMVTAEEPDDASADPPYRFETWERKN
ncbi:MAG: dihydrofolate reductase [Muribaculaceae bacterium]|nr:dihydrofolate reductase [Muribaculaceae bacterium]